MVTPELTGIHALGSGRDATAAGRIVQTLHAEVGVRTSGLRYPIVQMARTPSSPVE